MTSAMFRQLAVGDAAGELTMARGDVPRCR